MSNNLGALTKRSVHPASPVLLTKNGPLRTLILCPTSTEQVGVLTNLEFEKNWGWFNPKTSNHSVYLIKLFWVPAILKETLEGTSYKMVRLVFHPYTQVWLSICTSELLRASTTVSCGFTLFKHSSPSFGSQQVCSYSNLSRSKIGRSIMHSSLRGDLISAASSLYFHCACGFVPKTRAHFRLLGPCFKTGRMKSYDCQQPWHSVCTLPLNSLPQFKCTAYSPPW